MDRPGMDTTSISIAHSLSDNQVRELALIIRETFGIGLDRAAFADFFSSCSKTCLDSRRA
jgi:hypothetical protein